MRAGKVVHGDDLTDIGQIIKEMFVKKEYGMGLSTNDFTTADKQRLYAAYVKPTGGIPATDLAADVIPLVRIYVGSCPTGASTAEKVVTTETFPVDSNGKPLVGTVILVKFSATNTAANATLNVNSTGAASIWYNNAVYSTGGNIAGYANRYSLFAWNGTQWVWVSHGADNNTTYSAMSDAELKAGTATNARTITAARLHGNFYISGGTIHMGNDSITPLTSFTETDPTVPAWAKESAKPSYTAAEVGAQPTLVSGTNIKTVDGESLLGGGNVSTKTPAASSMPAGGFLPNVYYNLGELSGDTTFLMAAATDNTILNHWYWVFDTPSTAPTITWPAAITSWQGGSSPTVAASTHYEISVINGVAAYMEV